MLRQQQRGVTAIIHRFMNSASGDDQLATLSGAILPTKFRQTTSALSSFSPLMVPSSRQQPTNGFLLSTIIKGNKFNGQNTRSFGNLAKPERASSRSFFGSCLKPRSNMSPDEFAEINKKDVTLAKVFLSPFSS